MFAQCFSHNFTSYRLSVWFEIDDGSGKDQVRLWAPVVAKIKLVKEKMVSIKMTGFHS